MDRGPQFVAKMTKELNNILGIKTKLLTLFHPQTDRQTKHINQELEQYLQLFIDHKQKDWLEWLASAEFVVNNKAYSTTKMSLVRNRSATKPVTLKVCNIKLSFDI